MQLLNLEVKNWCQHREFTCSFGRGLIAIVGRNGSGKSNLFGAVRWLLTGENPNYGLKAENVAQLASEGEKSYCKLELEHAGHIATITRYILPEKEQATFLLDGEEAARGDKQVTAAVENLLGLDSKFISRFLLVQQDKLFRFIDDDKSDVDKFFQRLFATDKANKCQDVIGKHSNKITVPEIAVASHSLLAQMATLAEQIAELVAQISVLPPVDQVLTLQDKQQQIIQQWQARQKFVADLAAVESQIADTTKDSQQAATDCASYEDDLKALAAAADDSEEAQAAARVALGHWASYKQIAKAKDEITAAREQLHAKQQQAAEPVAVSAEDVDLAREQHKALQATLQSKQAVVEAFDNTGVAACPVCHTPTAQLADYLAECRTAVAQLQQDAKSAAARLARLVTQHAAYTQWSAQQREFEIAAAGLREQEQRLEHVTPPDTSEADLSQIVADYAEYQNARKEIEPVLQKTRAHKAKLDGVLATLQEQHAQLLEQISKNKTTAADFDLATAKIAKLSADASQRHKLEQERAQLLFEQKRLEELAHKTQHDEATAAVLLRWLESSALVREAFKAAPRLVAQRNLQKLETYVNDILQIFGVDFTVTTSDDNGPNFVANFADGRKQTAQRLSFGQKTVLAVAFRVAVVSLFSADAGFLALDEPTVYMDQPAVQSFSAVLEKLRDVSAASGLQCLIITHETGLSHAFESLIEIPSTLSRA